MDRLSAWLAVERYASTMVPQVLAVARGLSAWMDDQGVALGGLSVGVLDAFVDRYGPGVPGHVIVGMRLPALRRFLVEDGCLAGRVVGKRARRPVGSAVPPISEAAGRVSWMRGHAGSVRLAASASTASVTGDGGLPGWSTRCLQLVRASTGARAAPSHSTRSLRDARQDSRPPRAQRSLMQRDR